MVGVIAGIFNAICSCHTKDPLPPLFTDYLDFRQTVNLFMY